MLKRIVRRDAVPVQQPWPGLHPLMQQLLLSRDIQSPGDVEHELSGLLKPNLKDLPKAAALLADVVEAQGRILIVGDFDADGATSTALGLSALTAMGAEQVDFLVPNRFEYGYGLSPEIVEVAKQRAPDLLITVDNGISSIDGVAAARAAGMTVIVTDHHLAGDALPDADAIVNPNQPGCPFPAKSTAGVGVMFYVLSALRAELNQRGWFQDRPAPRLADYLDLVALGTVADVVPLEKNNRILVEQGLRRMRAGRTRAGIRALLQVAKRRLSTLVATDLGFALGPRLNAAGRLDDISIGIRLLTTNNEQEALLLATELDDLNRERREIEQGMQREALDIVDRMPFSAEDLPPGLCLYDPSWHQGVVGIVASRIKERFHRPVIVFADADDHEIKGSARSIPGVHMRDMLDLVAKAEPGLLNKFGGHAMAAGLSLARDKLPLFEQTFHRMLREHGDEDCWNAQLLSDGELRASDLNLDVAQLLRHGMPWGQQFPEPLFDGEFLLINQRIVGERHLKMVLAHPDAPQQVIDAIAFNIDTQDWPNHDVKTVQIAYKLDVNEFRGERNAQLLVEQIAPV